MKSGFKIHAYNKTVKNHLKMIDDFKEEYKLYYKFWGFAFDDTIYDIDDLEMYVYHMKQYEKDCYFKNWGVEVFITLMTQYKEQEKKYEDLYDVINNHYEYSFLNNVFYNIWHVDWDEDD